MAVTACIPNQAKLDFLQGIHLASHTYKCALYTQAAASFDASSTVYSATGEVGASGTYSAGGITMSGYTAALDGSTAYIDWSTDPSWTGATITADAAIIYNSSVSNKIIAILTFASASSTAGTWTLQLPAAAAATATVRIA